VQRFIIQANIARFEHMLQGPLDETRRRAITDLLEVEREKLAALGGDSAAPSDAEPNSDHAPNA